MSRTGIPDNPMMRKLQEVDHGRLPEDRLPPGSNGAPDGKMERIEESVRGNKGLSQAREDRGLDGGETEQAIKRAVEKAKQNLTVRRRG